MAQRPSAVLDPDAVALGGKALSRPTQGAPTLDPDALALGGVAGGLGPPPTLASSPAPRSLAAPDAAAAQRPTSEPPALNPPGPVTRPGDVVAGPAHVTTVPTAPAVVTTTPKRPAPIHTDGYLVPGSVHITEPPLRPVGEMMPTAPAPPRPPPIAAPITPVPPPTDQTTEAAVPETMSAGGLAALKNREGGFFDTPYQDSGTGLAIGYGMQTWQGKRVSPKLRITQAQADAEMQRQLDDTYIPIVRDALTVPVTQAQFDALVSVAWNHPPTAAALVQKLNAGEQPRLQDFLRSATVKGRPHAGLEARRQQEFAQFTDPDAFTLGGQATTDQPRTAITMGDVPYVTGEFTPEEADVIGRSPAAQALEPPTFRTPPLERPAPPETPPVTLLERLGAVGEPEAAFGQIAAPAAVRPVEGAQQFLHGMRAATHELLKPAQRTFDLANRAGALGREVVKPAPPEDQLDVGSLLDAGSDMLEGSMKVGEPLLIAGAVANLPGTLLTLASAWAASAAAGKAADLEQASPQMKRFVQNLAAAGAAVVGGKRVLEGAGRLADEASPLARAIALSAQLSGRAVGEARPVGAAATVAESVEATRPGYHAPIAAIDSGTPSSVQLPRGSGPAETLTEILRDSPLADAIREHLPTLSAEELDAVIRQVGGTAHHATFLERSRAADPAALALGGQPVATPERVVPTRPESSPATLDPDAAALGGAPVDVTGRALGGYAGEEHRAEDLGPPAGQPDRRAAVIARVQEKIANGEPLGTEERRADFEEAQRVKEAREALAPAPTGRPDQTTAPAAVGEEQPNAHPVGTVIEHPSGAVGKVTAVAPDGGMTVTWIGRGPDLGGVRPNSSVFYLGSDAGDELRVVRVPSESTVESPALKSEGNIPVPKPPQSPVATPDPDAAALGGTPVNAPTAPASPTPAATFQFFPKDSPVEFKDVDGKWYQTTAIADTNTQGQTSIWHPTLRMQPMWPPGAPAQRARIVADDAHLRPVQTAGLPAAAPERKVGESDAGPAVPEHRAPLAGAPPADGQGARSEGAPGSRRGARGPADGGRGERPDSERPVTDAGAGSDAAGVGVPPERSGRPGAGERRPGDVAAPGDFRITDATELAVGSARTRVTNNVAAIETVKRLEAEHRPATPDEQATLAKYVGWGGLSTAFKEGHPEYDPRLKAALTDAEYRSARASTPNAHYTSPVVITAVYDALARLGVRGPLRVLEPAVGVGHFFGLMPPELAAQASRTAVEMDSISARITAALYPHARVLAKPFQDATLAKDHYDLVLGNPPFGNYPVYDKAFRGRPKSLTSSIHNYFFAKALDLARPGGLVAFITSHYTLDAQDPTVREYLASKANFLGAVRLPFAAFKSNAGTEVVTDIIFLQKREPNVAGVQQPWVTTKAQGYADKRGAIIEQHVNEYFIAHPDMVLGTPTSTGKMNQRDDAYNVVPPGEKGAERVAHWQQHGAEQLAAAMKRLPQNVYTPPTTKAATPTIEQQLPSAAAPPDVREHAWFEAGGRLFINEHGQGVPITLDPPAAARVRGLLKIRDAVRSTMRAMLDPDATDAQIRAAQRTLTKAYDTFVDKHGYLARPKNYRSLREDPDVYTLLALEEWAPKATKPEKAAIFTRRTLRPHTPVTHVDTPKEALLVALNELGRVDWPRMAALTGQSEHELQLALEGLVFHDPQSGQWEHADRYLSGNVKAKLAAARAGGQRYALNVQALEAVQPPDLEPQDIAVRLGAPWVPPDVIGAFAAHLGLHGLTFTYSPILAKWAKNEGRFFGHGSVQNREQWGTGRKSAVDLLHTALNLGEIIVMDRVTRPDGSEGSVVNQAETIAAREKAQAQADEFKEWIWSDAPRAARLARIYNDTMNTMRLWEPDGSHLSLPGMSAGVTLRPHQKNFIWRGLQQPNALAHHVVGAGKTFAGIALALEKRRMGLARKPMVVVPNHLPQQWARDVLKLYPAARVLASQKADFDPKNRKRFLSRIATGDWDVVIVPYSHYGLIKTSDETFNDYLTQEIDALEEELKRARHEGGKNDPTVKELEKAKLNLVAKLRGLKDDQQKDDTVTFEELGVDMLIVDEAHNFKRLFFPTKMTRVAGVPSGKGSQRAFDLFVKSRYLAQANPTGGTVFLTGTPISNTMAEMFVLMRYLAQPMLNARGIPQFDGWAATFGEKVTAFEISPTGRGFRSKTRFARFTNMPELMQMYRSFADVQTADMLKLPTPKLKGGKAQLHTIPASTELNAYVETLLERYEAVLGRRGARPDPRIDNPLKITTDGRKAALDLRLVGEHQPEGGKIDESGQTIYDLWKREAHRKGTQLVFADLGAPNDKKDSEKFTVYDALKAKLVELGIPRDQIAFIHDPKTDAQKQALFESVRAGDVRVLMGSTEKMGAGTNVQDRLVAEHHLDAPWRPSDIEQREGRLLRQGNLFGDAELKSPEYDPAFEVEIHTYLSERSFDAYLWQLLESKARFITQAVKGDSTSREIDDADDIVISFGAAKAVATGNPAIMEHAKAQSDLARLEVSEANYGKRKWRLQKALAELPEQIEGWEQKARDARALVDAVHLPKERKDLTLTVGGKTLSGDDAVAVVQAALSKAQAGAKRAISSYMTVSDPVPVGEAAGVAVRVYMSTSFLGQNAQVTQHWQIATGDATLSKAATIGSGAMQSLYSLLETEPQRALDQATRELATLRSSLEAAQTEVAKPFAHAAAVKALRETIKTLEASLNLDAASLQKEAADAGTIVTTAEEDAADAKADAAQAAAEEGGDVPDDVAPDAEAHATRPTKGVTLQSTVLPGAAEFGEYVIDPAVRKAIEGFKQDRGLLRSIWAPATISRAAEYGAGTLRAHIAIKDQRIGRLRRNHALIAKAMDRWSHDESLTFWDVMQGRLELDALPPEWRPVAVAFRELLDHWTQAVVKRGLIRNYLEHYWPQEWQRGNPLTRAVARIIGRRPLAGPESYRRHRTIPSTRDGIEQFGLIPVSWNPARQLERKVTEMARSVMAFDIRKDLTKQGFRTFVPVGTRAPDGWIVDKDRGPVYGPRTVTTLEGEDVRLPYGKLVVGQYYLQPDVGRLLENHLSPGLWGRSAIFDAYRVLGNVTTQVLLGWSSFHLWMTGLESIISKQTAAEEAAQAGLGSLAARLQVQVGPHGLVRDLVRGYRFVKAFYADDPDARDVSSIIGQIVNAGGGFNWSEFEHENAPEKFMADLRGLLGAVQRLDVGGVAQHAGMAALRSPLALIELPTHVIMTHWVPYLKASAFLDLAEMELARLGGSASLAEKRRVLDQAWDAVDDRLGQLRRDNLFWNRTFEQILTGSFLSVTWNLGSLRHGAMALPAQVRRIAENVQTLRAGAGGGSAGPAGGPPTPPAVGAAARPLPARRTEPWIHRRMLWLFTGAVIVGLLDAMYEYLHTGHGPQSLKDLYAPPNGKVDENGRPERSMLISYAKDYYNWLNHPVSTVGHKLKPFLTMLYDAWVNEDFYGRQLRDPDDPALTQIGEVLRNWIARERPIAWTNAVRRAGAGAPLSAQLREWAALQAEPFVPASAEMERSQAENYLRSVQPHMTSTLAQQQHADVKRDLRTALKSGDTARTTALLPEMSRRSFLATRRTLTQDSLVTAFKAATLDHAIHAYELATPDERYALKPLFARKYGTLVRNVPVTERKDVVARATAALRLPVAKPSTSATVH